VSRSNGESNIPDPANPTWGWDGAPSTLKSKMRIVLGNTAPIPERITGDALRRLLARRGEFLGFLEKRVGSRAVAEDILQAAFVKGLERGGAIRDDETAVAWFYRLLRNAVIDHYRRESSHGRALEMFANELRDAAVPSPDVKDEVCQCVNRVLDDLKPEYRDALKFVDVEERSLAELAQQERITTNNATVRVHRAREALRTQVKLTCGVCATHGCVDCRCGAKAS
jgi:RNA polymerase sigma-70 factor, ECF subfamily